MSGDETMRDRMSPHAQPIRSRSLPAAEVRQLAVARGRRRTTARVGVGALAVAATVGVVWAFPWRTAPGPVAPTSIAVTPTATSPSPTRVTSSATPSAASATPGASVACSPSTAWATALSPTMTGEDGTSVYLDDASGSGVAERRENGQTGAGTLTWYPGLTRSGGTLIASVPGSSASGGTTLGATAVSADGAVGYVLRDGTAASAVVRVMLWRAGESRELARFAWVGPLRFDGEVLTFPAGDSAASPRLRRYDAATGAADVPTAPPGGGTIQGGFYVVPGATGPASVWTLAGAATHAPIPHGQDGEVQVAGAYRGEPVYTTRDAILFTGADGAQRRLVVPGAGGTLISTWVAYAAIAGNRAFVTVGDRLLSVDLATAETDAGAAFAAIDARPDLAQFVPRVLASDDGAVLGYQLRPQLAGSPGPDPAGLPRFTRLADLPASLGC